MKELQLTKGCVALVDDDDYDWLSEFLWFTVNTGYAGRNAPDSRGITKTLLMHRALCEHYGITGERLKFANGDGLDCQKINVLVNRRPLADLIAKSNTETT